MRAEALFVPQIAAGVDFLTITSGDPVQCVRMRDVAERAAVAVREANGSPVKPWRFHGYVGWTCGGQSYGSDCVGAIVMLSGVYANKYYAETTDNESKVTRIDFQVTCNTPGSASDEIERLFYTEDLTKLRESGKLHSSLIISGTGSTMYIGKRTSPTMGRLYDKSGQMDGVKGSILRYEVEIKNVKAMQAVRSLLQTDDPGAFIVSYVHEYFCKRGVSPIFSPTTGHSLVEMAVRESSNRTRLEWLRTTVAPVIRRLKMAGLQEEIESAIGNQLCFSIYDNKGV